MGSQNKTQQTTLLALHRSLHPGKLDGGVSAHVDRIDVDLKFDV